MKSILVVEDEPALAEVLEVILRGGGFDVAIAYDGRHALARLEQERPDLVLSDVMMPFVGGVELAQRIHDSEQLTHVPVLLMSAAPEVMAKVPRELYRAFLKKPFDLAAVLGAVERVLGPA